VASEASLQDIVLFELPTRVAAEKLLQFVTPTRLSWLETGDGLSVVGVFLYADGSDLAVLLRDVQDWLEHSSLAAIRFELDGRTYVLEARLPALNVA
jgi:hypothetical protein